MDLNQFRRYVLWIHGKGLKIKVNDVYWLDELSFPVDENDRRVTSHLVLFASNATDSDMFYVRKVADTEDEDGNIIVSGEHGTLKLKVSKS